MKRKPKYAAAGSLESVAVAYRSLADQAEMSLDEVVDMALAGDLMPAVRKAEQRKARSATIRRIMITRSKKDPPVV
jgi:hypothetical protein